MLDTKRIRDAFERNAKAMRLRPGLGCGTSTATCRVADGFTCETTDGTFKVVVDEPVAEGGNDEGPTPGFLIRAGLGSCYAMSCMMRAAIHQVPIDSLEVEVEADYDSRGSYGVADFPRGFTELRYRITVQSPAPEADILKIIDEADNYSSMLAVVRDPMTVKRDVRIIQPRDD